MMMSHSSSLNNRFRSFWLPLSIFGSVTLESGIALIILRDFGAAFDLIKTLEVDVFQIGHGDVLHVSMVESTLLAPKVTSLNDLFMMNLSWRRLNDNDSWSRGNVFDLRHLNGVSVVNLLFATTPSAAGNKDDNEETEDESGDNEVDPDHVMVIKCFGLN